jgi:hypothetical protein
LIRSVSADKCRASRHCTLLGVESRVVKKSGVPQLTSQKRRHEMKKQPRIQQNSWLLFHFQRTLKPIIGWAL